MADGPRPRGADYQVCSGDNCAAAGTCFRALTFQAAAERKHPRQCWAGPPNDPQEVPCDIYSEYPPQADS